MPRAEIQQDEFIISSDPALLDLDGIFSFLEQTYWGRNRSREMMRKALRNSFCFGVYRRREQIGFARVITDFATYGYLADVYILQAFRNKGLGRRLIQTILEHPELEGIRRWALITKDAQNLYKSVGFRELENPERHLEIRKADA